MDHPVLVAGAGPVGMTLALALQRRGVEVRIVDKAAARSDKSKALVIWPRTLELLDIEGCVQPFIEAGMQAVGARILGSGKLLVHVALETARSAYRYALMIPQSETERLLDEQLVRFGVRVEREVELLSFADEGDGVAAVLRHADGRAETFRAAYLAGCDGAHSTVRHGLAVEFDGETLPSEWTLADIEIDGDIPRDELTICWTPEGILAFFPIRGSRFRVIADVEVGTTARAPTPTLSEVQTLLDSRGPTGLRAHDPIWMSRFHVNERKVKDYRRGRVFLAGDAAHVHSPAGGQGMNTGMQDAFNLAWKLALVRHGRASSALLDTYSPERSGVGDQVLRNAGRMTKVAILENPILQELRNLAVGSLGRLPALRQHLVDQLTEIDLHYPDSALTQKVHGAARHPAGGERAPDVPLARAVGGATRLHELLSAGKFVVLSVAVGSVELPAGLCALATAAEAAAAPGYDLGHVFLVRPDAYVALSTRGGDTSDILAALERLANGARSADT